MTLTSSSEALLDAMTSMTGGNVTPFYFDRTLAIPFNEGTSEFDDYYNQLKATGATEYVYISVEAAGGHASNTFGGLQIVLDGLSPADRARPMMLNLEYPWLEILTRRDVDGDDPAWEEDFAATLAEESVRAGLPYANLAQKKALAVRLWQDASNLAAQEGCPEHIHYSATTSFSDSVGIPYSARRATNCPTGAHRMSTDPVFYPTMRERIEAMISGGSFRDYSAAQLYATAHGPSIYCFNANAQWLEAYYQYWLTTGTRYNGSGVAQATNFDPVQLRRWIFDTSRRSTGEYRRALYETYRRRLMPASHTPRAIDIVVLGPSVPPQDGNFVSWQHQCSLAAKDIERCVEDEILALFAPGDADWNLTSYPRGIWWWNDMRYYFHQLVNNQKASTPLIAMSRWAFEVLNCKRPYHVASSGLSTEPTRYGAVGSPPAGFTSWDEYHRAHYDQHSMGDGWYNDDSNGWWWTVAGGNQLPAPCVMDQTSPLAPWLDFSANVGRVQVMNALKHQIASRSVSFVSQVMRRKRQIGR